MTSACTPCPKKTSQGIRYEREVHTAQRHDHSRLRIYLWKSQRHILLFFLQAPSINQCLFCCSVFCSCPCRLTFSIWTDFRILLPSIHSLTPSSWPWQASFFWVLFDYLALAPLLSKPLASLVHFFFLCIFCIDYSHQRSLFIFSSSGWQSSASARHDGQQSHFSPVRWLLGWGSTRVPEWWWICRNFTIFASNPRTRSHMEK